VIAGSSLTVSADRFDAWVCGDRQLMAARPDTLSGLPIGVKDVIATRDYPTRCGTDLPQEVIQVLLEKGEADCISDLKQAGAIVAGENGDCRVGDLSAREHGQPVICNTLSRWVEQWVGRCGRSG
jgi:hypothetical protein